MRKRDRQRIYAQFANNGGRDDAEERPKKPQPPKRPTRIEEPDSSDEEDWDFKPVPMRPMSETATMEVTPNGTQRATRRFREGNESAVLRQSQYMYNDRDSARKIQQQMRAEELAHQATMERMKQDYKVNRDRLRADMAAAKRAQEEERERWREELETRRREDRHRREAERRRAEEDAERIRLEAKARRQRERVERAANEAADRRRHEREMFVLNNGPDMTERLINTRIRQAEAVMKQAQDRVRFQDERSREYVGKINVRKEQRGERFDKDIEVVFAQFGLDAPDVETMKQPNMTQEIRLHSCKNKQYVYSRLLTGVDRVHYADNNGYIEFVNGERLKLPGAAQGLITNIVYVMPYVYIIHVYYFTPELLASLGYSMDNNEPFDCCKRFTQCVVQ